ncbi:MAG: biotin synthase BioB [Candidatus Omnitrophica bacterium]|nr:biotin synthase BioB [Candidatus Omnitrophota bacterium]
MNDFIDQLKARIFEGGQITFEEARRLIEIEDRADLDHLLKAAWEITFHFHSNQPAICSLVNAKSYLCGEDCAFCAQSVHFNTEAPRYRLMTSEEILKAAKVFEAKGIRDFCVVTSGVRLTDDEFEGILKIYRRLRTETRLNLDGSLGFLNKERVQKLKEAGVRRVNSNLQSSREFYPKIVSSHTYESRLEALRMLREGAVEVCAGGILNVGETREDRIRLAFELKPFSPHCFPVNILHPRPGTPLEYQPRPEPEEMLKTIAVFRFIHPHADIKLAGGREYNLTEEEQQKALQGGANGLIMGGYLTTQGNPINEDFGLLKRAGYQIPKIQNADSCKPADDQRPLPTT